MLARMTCQQNARKCGGEFQKFSLSLVESFSFNGIILTVIALDAVLIGIQASGYVAMKSGNKYCSSLGHAYYSTL